MKTGATRRQIYKIWSRDNGVCWICGKHVELEDASRDHFVPRSKGGINNITNLKLAHKLCNSKRGNGDPVPKRLKKAARVAAINVETGLEFTVAEMRGRRMVLEHITNDNAVAFKKMTEEEKISLQKRDEA